MLKLGNVRQQKGTGDETIKTYIKKEEACLL